MKHKLNSMGRVAIALVLALSLCLVMTVPVSAAITTIDITAPTVGEHIRGSYEITWTHNSAPGDTVEIGYSVTGGGTWVALATLVPSETSPGSWTWDTTSVADGENYQVRVVNSVDTEVKDISGVFTIDNTEPAVTIDIPEYINDANVLAVPVTITSDEDGTYSYNISGVIDTGPITAAAPVELELDLSTLAEGAVTADASVTDAAGNVGDALTDPATKDTGVPAVPTNLAAPNYINDANQATYTVPGNAEIDSTVELRISDGTITVTNTGTAVGGVFSIPVDCSTLDDGTGNIIIDAKATDAAGNESPYCDAILRDKDTLLPVVTIDIPEYINADNELAVPVTITSDEDGAYGYNISGVSDTGTIIAGVPIVLELALNGLAEGAVIADASVTDAAGNVGVAPPDAATKDVFAPAAPIALDAPTYINDANQATYTVTGSAEADSTVEVRITDGLITVTNTGTAVGGAFSVELSTGILADGTDNILIDAKATDVAGNVGSYCAIITRSKDTECLAPVIELTDPINIANEAGVAITGTGEADATLAYTITDEGVGEVTGAGAVDALGVIDITGIDVSALDDGTLTASVTQTDVAGNTSAAGTDTATKDTECLAPVIELTDPINAANEAGVSITGTGEPNATLAYTISDGAAGEVTGAGTVDGGGVISITGIDVSTLDDGTLTASVTQTDAAGNTSAAGTDTSTKDTLLPAVTINIPAYINAANKLAVPVTITSDENGDYSYKISGVIDTGTITAGVPVVLSLDLSGLAEGAVTADASVTDAAGNVGVAMPDAATKDTECLAPVIELTDPINTANEAGVSITGTGEPNATLAYTITDGAAGEVTGAGAVDALGVIDITGIDVGILDDGTLTASVTQTDVAGNTSAAGTDTATKDTLLPVVTINIPAYINAANAGAVPVTITSNENGTYSYNIGGVIDTGTITAGVPVVLSPDLSGLAEGAVTADASVTDAVGNVGDAVQDTATKDTECLAPVIELTDPINAANAAGVSITGTGEANATLAYTITDEGVGEVTGAGAVDALGVIDITGIDVGILDDGTLTASVTQTDVAGNTSTAGTDTATKDTLLPVVTIDISEYINAANVLAVPATITSDENGEYVYNISDGFNHVIDTGSIDAGVPVELSLNLSALDEGGVTAFAEVTDAAGNVGVAPTDTATKDTLLPAVTIDIPDYINAANAGAVPVIITSGENGDYSYNISGVTGDGPITVGVPVGLSLDLSGLADGPVTADATVTDAAGNVGNAPTDAATKDTTLPVIAINDVATPTNVVTQTISGTFTEVNLDTIVVTVGGGGVAVTIVADTWMTTAPADLSEGENAIVVTITDLAGNSAFAEATINLDTEVPTITDLTPLDGAYVGTATPTISVLLSDANSGIDWVSIVMKVGGINVPELSYNPGTGVVSYTPAAPLDDGAVAVIVNVSDLAGNAAAEASWSFTVDTTLPVIAIDEVNSPTNVDTQTISGTFTEVNLDTIVVTVGGGGVAVTIVADTWMTTAPADLSEGGNAIVVTITDLAGNPAFAEATIKLDTEDPVVMVTSPDGGEIWLAGTTHNITWIATDDNDFGATPITIRYSINGGADWKGIGGAKLANTGTYSWTVPNLNSTTVFVKVMAVDRAGNIAADDSNSVFTITADIQAPSVTVNSPNGGESFAGNSIRTISWTADDNQTPSPGLTIDLYYSTNGGTTWTSIATSEANDGAYAWTVVEANSSQCLVRVKATDSAGNAGSDTSNNVFTISPEPAPAEEVISIDLKIGWNFISVPKSMADDTDSFEELLAGIGVEVAYSYDPVSGWSDPLVPADPIEVLEGYWIDINIAGTITLSYKEGAQEVPASKPLVGDAWNAIGYSSTTAQSADTALMSVDGSWSTVLGWDAEEQAYEDSIIFGTTGDLFPGKGYWIWMTEDDVLSAISG